MIIIVNGDDLWELTTFLTLLHLKQEITGQFVVQTSADENGQNKRKSYVPTRFAKVFGKFKSIV